MAGSPNKTLGLRKQGCFSQGPAQIKMRLVSMVIVTSLSPGQPELVFLHDMEYKKH